jgi:hypothetical protein
MFFIALKVKLACRALGSALVCARIGREWMCKVTKERGIVHQSGSTAYYTKAMEVVHNEAKQVAILEVT